MNTDIGLYSITEAASEILLRSVLFIATMSYVSCFYVYFVHLYILNAYSFLYLNHFNVLTLIPSTSRSSTLIQIFYKQLSTF